MVSSSPSLSTASTSLVVTRRQNGSVCRSVRTSFSVLFRVMTYNRMHGKKAVYVTPFFSGLNLTYSLSWNATKVGKGPDYLTQVLEFVSKYKLLTRHLKSPAGATLTIGNLDVTMYKEKPREVNGWGKFYLPDIVNMQVIGVVEGTSCPCDQLVLMTCEDRKVYGYDGEELHVVAASLKELDHKGIEYPASKSYYNGEAFKDMKDKDWDKVRKGAVGRRLDEEHRKLVTTGKSKFLENFKLTCGYLCHCMQGASS